MHRDTTIFIIETRRDDFNKINNGYKINDDSDTEIIYASGDWAQSDSLEGVVRQVFRM
ncbi:MAG: hypothetical protein WAZ77_06165 [Candidatus Nitrosopolaris sp.]